MGLADELYARGKPILEERRARLRRIDDTTHEMLADEHAQALRAYKAAHLDELRELRLAHLADVQRWEELMRAANAEIERLRGIVAVDRKERTLTAAIKAAERFSH